MIEHDSELRDLRARLAQAERERDTALYDAKGCAKASLMIAGDFAKAEARAQELEAALREIAEQYVKAPGHAAPIPTTELVWGMYKIAREALTISSPSPKAEARETIQQSTGAA